jgi:hypothetical protein
MTGREAGPTFAHSFSHALVKNQHPAKKMSATAI